VIIEILKARLSFSEIAALDDEALPLDRAALALALEEYPELNVREYLSRIDTMAARAEVLIGADRSPVHVIERINEILFVQEGLRGNSDDYYDPRNSYLNEVLDRRLGIPISLSLIYMEVARRIAEVTLSACASTAYLARRGTPAQPPDLLQHELIGYDQHDDLLRGFAAMGFPVTREHFAVRTDDLIAAWEAVRAGLGVGFAADYTIDTDPAVQRLLPMLPLPRLPIWLTVHREIRNSGRIRAVYDFLAQAVPQALAGHTDPEETAA